MNENVLARALRLGVDAGVAGVKWRPPRSGATSPARSARPPCARCGRAVPIDRFRLEHLRMIGWRLFAPATFVNWCGHAQEFVPLPDGAGRCWLVPVIGEAW